MLAQYLMLALTQLTWQNPPFRQELGVQSLMLTSQFVPVHPPAQLRNDSTGTEWKWNGNGKVGMNVCILSVVVPVQFGYVVAALSISCLVKGEVLDIHHFLF